MAGETQKSTSRTNLDLGIRRSNIYTGGTVKFATDYHEFQAATELEAGDTMVWDIPLPSGCIVEAVAILNDDMDTDGTPALTLDFGLNAREDYEYLSSGVTIKVQEGDVIDKDVLVDGSTQGQSANTQWTVLTPDSGNQGANDSQERLWEVLGYDEDPKTTFDLTMTSTVASDALSSPADLAVRVTYIVV